MLEIGPGIGVLTCKLGMTGANVVAVEIDTSLMPLLAETLEVNKPCPVCGSTSHPKLATKPIDVPTKEELMEEYMTM